MINCIVIKLYDIGDMMAFMKLS